MNAETAIKLLRKTFVSFADDEGYEVCDEYDPAGSGAGVGEDGQPVCAMCGFARIVHDIDILDFPPARGDTEDT